MKAARPSIPVNFGKCRSAAFSVVELLVVIAIIGLMAAVGLPALKGFGKSNAISAADRQMLDDIAFARQRALAEHTDVYMLFVSSAITNINWTLIPSPYTAAEKQQMTNVFGQQYSGYAFYVRRTVGDQPGRPNGRYLTSWRSLPNGIFIKTNKFIAGSSKVDGVSPFTNSFFPFPTATNVSLSFPYLQFNHLGQLVDPQDNGGEIIPFARGSIFYDTNLNADFFETPPGNSSTNSTMYNRVRIDGLTGRARIERYVLQ
jgi:type II secretory pathway pseudopilin PulG